MSDEVETRWFRLHWLRHVPAGLPKTAIWAAGILVTAIVGAVVKDYYDRPRLSVELSAPALTPAAAEGEQTIVVPADLRQALQASTWAGDFEPQEKLGAYLKGLASRLESLSSIRFLMERLRSDLPEWPDNVDPQSLHRVYKLLRTHASVGTGHLFGEVRRGVEVLPEAEPDYSKMERKYRVSEDTDGDFYVDHGSQRLPIVWSVLSVMTEEERRDVQRFAKRLAYAVAYGHPAELRHIRRALATLLSEESSVRDLVSMLEREQRAYSHWSIKAIVTNHGRNPAALATVAQLYIQTRGEFFKDGGEDVKIDTNIALSMQMRPLSVPQPAQDALSQVLQVSPGGGATPRVVDPQPVVIAGGEAVAIEFESRQRVNDMKSGVALLQMFTRAKAKCALAVLPITRSSWTASSKYVLSEPAPFGGFSESATFPSDIPWQ